MLDQLVEVDTRPVARIEPLDPFGGFLKWSQAAKSGLNGAAAAARRRIRVAYLATYTTDFLHDILPMAAGTYALDVEMVKTPFAQLEQCLLGPRPALRSTPLDYVILAGTWHDLGLNGGAAAAVIDVVDRWSALWEAASAMGARVVQLGFVPPAADPYGLNAAVLDAAPSAAIRRINTALAQRAAGRVLFLDTAAAASHYGLRSWDSPRYWHSARLPCHLDALPVLAATIAGGLAADCGLTRRCVVLDLDNTLWGGVLGEEGPRGIALGEGSTGEAFSQFQHYLRGLRERGITLAIASKNDAEAVCEVFRSNVHMVLKESDFACVVADWRPKSQQLAEIAERLHLLPRHMIFVDDNPAERAEVARALPEVEVLSLPARPSGYASALAATPGLFCVECSVTDSTRAVSYSGLRRAEELAKQTASLGDFLSSLQMTGSVRRLEERDLVRAAQLVVKTNQFNLTGRRRTQAELEALMRHEAYHIVTLQLRDRFADHGLVGLGIACAVNGEARIDTLLLSCRVIGRTAEQWLVAALAEWARRQDCSHLVGEYRASKRNELVANLYPELGFTCREQNGEAAEFEFDLRSGMPSSSPYITEVAS